MANSDKNIRIETNKGKSGYPNIAFIGSTNDPINLYVLDDNTLSFEGSTGQLFSVSNSVTSGTIFSVNDISGIPSLRVDADGTVGIAEFSGNVGVGTVNPLYKLDVNGDINAGSGKTLRIGGVRVLDSTTLGSTIVNSSLTGFGTVTSGTWNGTPIAVLYGGTGATTAADARTNLSAATAGTNSDITVLNAVQRMLVTIPSATGIGITVRGATSQTGNLQQWQNSSASNLSWINSSGTFSFGASFTHADGRTPGVSVQAPNAAGIVARGFNSDAFPAIEVQNNPGGLSVGLYPSGLVYGGVLQAYSSTASTSSTTGVLLVAGGAGIAKTSYFGQSVVIQGTTASGSTTTGALVVTGGVGIGGTLNVNTANVVTDFNHTPNNTTIGGASGWVASTASTFISPGTFRYLNNKYIGIGGTYVYYSDDMINWSSVMVPNLDPARPIANITYGEGKYVFVQYYTANAGYSTNLTNWTNVAIQYQTWNDVIYGNGRFVATVGGDLAAYSLDGTSWTSVTDSIALGFNTSLKFLNGYFYVTNANAISRSIDGIIWQVCNTPAVPYGLAYGNGLYVGGIYNSGTIVYSYDGLNFSSYSGSSFVHNGSFFYNGVYYLTTQNNNVIRYSTDGFNWTNSTGFPGAVFNLQYIKGFLYAGSGNTVWVTNATPGRFEVNPLRTGTLDDVEIGRLSPNNANFIDVSVNNNLNVSSQYSSTSPLNGALTVAGGVGIAKTSYFGQSVVIQGATASGSTTTGALSVSGGVGIGGSLNVFGTIDVSNNIEILAQKELRFFNSGNTFYTGLKSGSSSANVTFTLPIADGSANQVLYTNGSAALGWTTLPAAITSLNGLTAATQTFATGTSGSDFNISSSTSTHTFNIPYAGAASTGLITTQAQTIAGAKTFSGNTNVSSSTASTNTTTGALVVTGGVGIGSSVNIGGKVGINTGVYTGAFNITTPSASTPGLVVQGSTSQTADYLQILSSTGTTSLTIDSSYKIAWPNTGTNPAKIYGTTYSTQGRVVVEGNLFVSTGPFIVNTGGGEASMTSTSISFGGVGWGSYGSPARVSTDNAVRIQPTSTSVVPLVVQLQNASWTSGNAFEIQNNGVLKFNVDYAGSTSILSTVGSASTTTGALVVTGGVGIGGSVNAGGISRFTSATASTSSSSGALIVTGGIGVGQTSYFASDEYVQGRLYLNQATLGVAGTTVNPSIAFIGQTNNPITLSILSDNSLSFEGSSGQLFSINNNLTSGTIFSVSDISGLPILRANANGTLSMAEFGTNVGIGTSLPNYKLHVMGDVNIGTGYTYRINGTKVVDAVSLGSAVVSSSLTSVGTLNSGVWNATTIGSIYGGTGQTTYTDGQLLIGSSTGGTLIKSTLTQGSGILITTSAGSITISTSGSGITSLNGLSAATQTFATGTSGTDFNISSSTSTHTFNIPYAGSASTGLITTQTQTIAGAKTFSGNTIVSSSTASTSSTTGALVVTGGVGIGGSLNVNNKTRFNDEVYINSLSNNALYSSGSGGVAYNWSVGGNLSSNKYFLGLDLGLHPVGGNQSIVQTFWGLQLVGNSGVVPSGYTPSAVGANNAFGVLIPNQQAASVGLAVIGHASQTGDLQIWTTPSGLATTTYLAVKSNGQLYSYASIASGSTTTGALVVTGGVGIGGSLWTSSSNLSSISGVTLNNGTITGTLSGTATTATNQSTTTLSGTMFLHGQAANTGVATGTTAFVGSGLSFVSSTGTLTAAFYNGSGIQLSGIVTSLASSTGISVNSSTGAVTVTNTGVISLTGTANQVLVNGASGVATSSNITLTTPQSIGTASSPSFADVTLTTGANSTLAAVGSAPTSIVNKQYVDNLAAGLDIHESMRVLQASAIGASYVQTQTAGAAATSSYLISTTQVALPAIDGVTISATGTTQRILIAGGFTGSATIGGTAAFTPGNSFIANGSYYVAALGGAGTSNWILVRTPDADDNVELTGGTFTFIEEGTSYADSGWVCSNDTLNQGSIQFGSTAISFTQFTGGGALTVGQGLTKVGNNISANIKISAIGSASGIGYTQFNLGGTSGGGTADTGYYPTFAVRTSGAAAGSAILTLNTDGFSLVGSTNSNRTITVTGSDITLTGGGNTLTLTGSISLPAPTQNGIAYGSSSTALAFMTAAGSGASVLTQISGSAPVYLGQSQLVVGGATTAALVNTDASTATRYLVGTVLNTASGSTQLSTGSGITIGDNRLTSGGIAVTNTTASTSTTTGALVVTGGVGIAKTSYFGQDVKIQGSTASTNQTTGALTVTGGVGISGRLNVGTKSGYIDTLGTLIAGFAGSADSSSAYVKIENTSPDFFSHTSLFLLNDLAEAATIYYFNSNSFDFSKALFIENNYGDLTLNVGTGKTVKIKTSESNTTLSLDSTKVSIAQTTVSTSSTTGALTLVGGAGIAKTSYFGQSVVIQGSTASGSTTTGALVVSGGVGIGGSLNVFGTIDVADNIEVLSQKEVRFFNSANTFYTGLRSGSSSANVTFTLPVADGSANQVLYTNGSAALGWTTIASAITTLNGLTASTQTFATGTSGSDFNISSGTSTHTFNIPYAGSGATGLITTGAQTIAGAKTFSGNTIVSSSTGSTNPTTGALIVTGGVGIGGTLNVGPKAITTTNAGYSVALAGFASSINNQDVNVTIQNTSPVNASVSLRLANDLSNYAEFQFHDSSNILEYQTLLISNYNGDVKINSGSGNTIFFQFDQFNRVSVNDTVFKILPTTGSTSSSTGALVVNGGAGIADTSYFGRSVFVRGLTASGSTDTGALVVRGGAGIAKTSYFGQSVVIQGSTASTNQTTGALVITGGVGISGRLNVGIASTSYNPYNVVANFSGSASDSDGLTVRIQNTRSDILSNSQLVFVDNLGIQAKIRFWNGNDFLGFYNNALEIIGPGEIVYQAGSGSSSFHNFTGGNGVSVLHTTVSTSSTTGALTVNGGAGIALTSYFGQSVVIQGTTASGSTTTGALTVSGGVGIGGSLNVFGTIDVADNIEVLSQKEVRFFNSANTFYTGLRSGSSSANVTFTLPIADGSANQVLYTNGSAALGWTTIASAITTLNGLTASTQTFATGTSGTDFNISSSTSTHTFNIPDASGSNRGLVTTGAQTIAGAKTFSGNTIVSSSTASTNTTTGALVVSGGVGIGGTVNINGSLNSGPLASPVITTYQQASFGSADFGTLTPSTTYYYVVTALSYAGRESLPSAQVSVSLNSAGTSISLQWSKVPGAKKYKVYRSTVSGVFTNSYIITSIFYQNDLFTDYGFPTSTGTPPSINQAFTNELFSDISNISLPGNTLHGLNIPSGSLSVNSTNDAPLTAVEISGDTAFVINPESSPFISNVVAGGSLAANTLYYYRISFVDMRGNESLASDIISAFNAASTFQCRVAWNSSSNFGIQSVKIYRSTNINVWTNTLIGESNTGSFTDSGFPQLNFSPVLTSSSFSSAYISANQNTASSVTTSLAISSSSRLFKVNETPTVAAFASTEAGTLTTNTTYYYKAVYFDQSGGTSRYGPEVSINTGSGTAISLSVNLGQNQGAFVYRSTTPNFTSGSRLFTIGTVIDNGSISGSSSANSNPFNGCQWTFGNALLANLLPSSLTIAPPSNGFGLGIAASTPSITTIADGSIAGTLTTGTKYYYRIVGLDAFGQSTSSFQIVNYIAPATGSIFLQFGSSRMGFSSFNVYRSTNTNSFSNTLIGNFRNNYFTDVGFATTSGSPRLSSNLAKDIYLKGVNDNNINAGFGVISNGFYTRSNVPIINTGYGVGPNSGTLTTNTNYYYKIRVHFWADNTVGEVSDPIKVNTGSNTAVYLQWTPIEGAQHYTLYRSTNPRIFTNAIIINGIKDNYVYDFNHSVATETPTANYNGSNTAIGDTYGSRLSSLLIMGDNQKLRSLFDAPKFSTYPTSTTGGTLANNTVFFYTVVARGYTGETSLASSEIRVDTGSNNAVSLNWLNVNGATGYDVYRSTAINSWTNTLIASNVQSTSFVDINYSVTTGTPNRLNAYGVGYAESLFENNYNILGRSIFGSVNNVDSAYQNFTVRINGNIFRNSSASTLQVGTGFTNGYTFSGSSNGTELAIASGTGFTGSLFDAHSNGSSRFSINFDGSTSIGSSTASTNTTTGALTVTGGAGIAKTSYFGQDVKILGSTASTSPTTGALVVTGGVGISGRLYIGQPIDFPTTEIGIGGSNCQITLKNTYNGPDTKSSGLTIVNNADIYASFVLDQSYSSNPNRLSIINDGNIYYATYGTNTTHTFESPLDVELTIGGTGVSVLRSTASTSTTTGALTVTGGAGIAKTSYFGQSVVIQGTTGSASTTTGALTVTGGVGIGGSLNVFGTIDVADNIEVLSQKEVRFFNSANTFYTGLRAGSSAANVTFTLPVADGSANQVLYTNGSAGLAWTTIASVSAITTLNSLTAATQTFATGTSGTDFNISSSTSTHTFNIPYAGSGATGLITTGAQTIAGSKTFSGNTIISSSTASTTPTTGALTVTGGVGISGKLNVGLAVSAFNEFDNTLIASFVSNTDFSSSSNVVIQNTNAGEAASVKLSLLDHLGHEAFLQFYNSTGYYGGLLNLLYIGSPGGISLNTGFGTSDYFDINCDPGVRIYSSTASTSSTTGGLTVYGGIGIGLTSYFGQDVKIQGTTASGSTATGALTVTGGVGIGGSLWTSTANLSSISGVSFINSTITSGVWSGTAISAVNGGTGQVSYTVGDLLYASSTTALSKLAAGTAGSVLKSNGAGTAPSWQVDSTGGGGGSGTVTSGTAGSIAYYTGTGTTVGGSPGFTYTTSGTASTINVFGGSAIGTTIFTVQATSATSVRVGIGTNLPQYELEIVGELSATNKSFVIDHPTKPGKKLRYGSLEGPENGVYVRGELKDSNIIETPDHWEGLVHPDSFTVTLTPIGRFSYLYVEKIEDYKVFIADEYMNPIHCYYTVWAERKDIPKLVTEY